MTLKPKQLAQVNKAPQANKASMRAMFERQNAQSPGQSQPQPKRRAQRPTPVQQQQQQQQLQKQQQQGKPQSVPRTLDYAFDGFDKRHLPLDEVTAPYTTTNFVSTMEFTSQHDMDQVIVVCPRMSVSQENYLGPLTDYIAMRYDAAEAIDGSIPALQEVRSPIIDAPAVTAALQYSSVRARLHNMSVKLECLGTNTGLYPPGSVYMGTVPVIETGLYSKGNDEGLTIKQAWADDSIMVGYIKSISAASLVEQPAVLHAAVAENVSYKSWRDMSVPASSTNKGALSFSTALEPIVLYVPRAGAIGTVVNYRVVIGQQWCSRHPHNVMLRSTQKQHPPTSSVDWQRALGAVKDVGEHLLARAGGSALDILTTRMRQAFNPAQAIADIGL